MAKGNLSSALYYPHTGIKDPGLWKTALLLWDDVRCIAPDAEFSHPRFRSRALNEAVDLLYQPLHPSDSQKQRAHTRVEKFLELGIPRAMQVSDRRSRGGRYLVYPSKFLDRTWRLLQGAGLADFDRETGDYEMEGQLGLLLMSFLANACAGRTRSLVTDKAEAYALLFERLTRDLGGEYLPGLSPDLFTANADRLVTLSIAAIDERKIRIDRLVKLRAKEVAEPGYREMRHTYLAGMNGLVGQLVDPDLTLDDKAELERQYRADVEHDLRDLKRELGVHWRTTLLSKEMGVLALAVAGSVLLGPAAAGSALIGGIQSVGLGALVRSGIKYRDKRMGLQRRHASSWLYAAT